MELRPIENLQKPNKKVVSNLTQSKNLIKKFLFDKEIIKIKENKSPGKENFVKDAVEISNISFNNQKNIDHSNQKNMKKNEENDNSLDFRDEIEKRFKKSVVNKIYIFPKNSTNENFFDNSSSDSSQDSLKNIEIYDLKFQKIKENVKKPLKENEQDRKNMSFQDFLTKIQEEKDKWKIMNQNTGSITKQPLIPSEETHKKPNKNMKNSESVLQINRNTAEKFEANNFSLINKRTNNGDKVIKGRKIEVTFSQKQRMNASGSNSKRKDNTSNIFCAINSFHNKLFPKEKFFLFIFVFFLNKSF